MTLVLKADVTANKSMGSVFKGLLPPSPLFSLDFVIREYKRNAGATTVADLSFAQRIGAGDLGYVNDSGGYNIESSNAAIRIHNSKVAGRGAVSEPLRKNELPNPTSPVSGTYTIPFRPNKYTFFEVVGTGSARFFLEGMFDVVVTEDKPFAIPSSITSNPSATVTVSGNLDYFGAYSTTAPTKSANRHSDIATYDRIYIRAPKEVTEFSIAFERKLLQVATQQPLGAPIKFNFVQFLGDKTAALGISDILFGSGKKHIGISGGVQTEFGNSIEGSLHDSERIVITFSKSSNQLKIASNGAVTKVSASGFLASDEGVDRIILGEPASKTWTFDVLSQVFKEFYYYDRVLTDAEMVEATK